MKLENIKENGKNTNMKQLANNLAKMGVQDSNVTSPVFAYPTIEIDESVKILEKHLAGREELENKLLTVKEIYPKDLGDMTVYIVKFKETNDVPYLAHHFYTYIEHEE